MNRRLTDVRVKVWGHSLDDCAFGAPCSGEHDPGSEADSQIILIQAQQLGTIFQSLTRLLLQNAATWHQNKRLVFNNQYGGFSSDLHPFLHLGKEYTHL